MAMRYFTYGHALFYIWPCAILHMAMRYFTYGHTLFCIWTCAILHMAIRYFTYGYALFYIWPCAILHMTMRYPGYPYDRALFCKLRRSKTFGYVMLYTLNYTLANVKEKDFHI